MLRQPASPASAVAASRCQSQRNVAIDRWELDSRLNLRRQWTGVGEVKTSLDQRRRWLLPGRRGAAGSRRDNLVSIRSNWLLSDKTASYVTSTKRARAGRPPRPRSRQSFISAKT